jgi:regulator of replication initiation timing
MPMFRRDRSSRLAALSQRLVEVRTQLGEATAQAAALADEAEDLRIRALVSDDLEAEKEHKQAARHAERAARAVERLRAERSRLEAEIDALLDQPV